MQYGAIQSQHCGTQVSLSYTRLVRQSDALIRCVQRLRQSQLHLLQGVVLEPAMGSARFAVLVAELLLVSQTLLTLAAAGLAAAAPAVFGGGYRSTCAVGFSGVLFALKVAVVVVQGSGRFQAVRRASMLRGSTYLRGGASAKLGAELPFEAHHSPAVLLLKQTLAQDDCLITATGGAQCALARRGDNGGHARPRQGT